MLKEELKTILQNMMRTGLFHNNDQARDIFIASLFALRDRLSHEQAIHLGTILPKSLREKYLDGWDKTGRVGESVNKSEFLAEVDFHLDKNTDWSLDDLVPVALEELLKLLSNEDVSRIRHAVPKSMQNIFEGRLSME